MHHTIFSTIFCIDKPRGSHSYLFIAFCPQQRQDSGGTSHKCPLAPPADTFSSHVSFAFLHHCPTIFTWLPFMSLQLFNQSQWYPGPGPYLTWGARSQPCPPWFHTQPIELHGEADEVPPAPSLCTAPCAPHLHLKPRIFCTRTHSRAGNGISRHLLLPQGTTYPTSPIQCLHA